MVKERQGKSSMYVAITSRLLGLATTIFILMLTIKSELLSNFIITSQLVLSIPFLLGSMLSCAKIIGAVSLKKYVIMFRATNATAIALLFNTLGLLVSMYISRVMGILFFISLLGVFFFLIALDYRKTRLYSEGITFVLIVLLGLLPVLKVY
jgi:hypothetical protein